jgi:hypothetical protein
MRISTDYQKEIIRLAKELPNAELKKVIDFALFLKTKKEGFNYRQVDDSVAYVRDLRAKEGKRHKSADQFIQELMEWQTSNS